MDTDSLFNTMNELKMMDLIVSDIETKDLDAKEKLRQRVVEDFSDTIISGLELKNDEIFECFQIACSSCLDSSRDEYEKIKNLAKKVGIE